MRRTLIVLAAVVAMLLSGTTAAVASQHTDRPAHNPNPPCDNPGAAGDMNPHCPEGPPGHRDPIERGDDVETDTVETDVGDDGGETETETVEADVDADDGDEPEAIDADVDAGDGAVDAAGEDTALVGGDVTADGGTDDAEDGVTTGGQARMPNPVDLLVRIQQLVGAFSVPAA